MVSRLKIGFVGCGGIASMHASRLFAMKEVALTAFCDVVKEKAFSFMEKYGGRSYIDYHDMFDKEPLDIVFICLPPYAHKDEVMVAAEKGVNIYIEKPIALDMDLAWGMVKAVEKAGVKSQVGYQCRFGAGVEESKRIIDSGEAGAMGLATSRYFCNFSGGPWWRDLKKSGGQVVEQATHTYDALRYLCGDVEKVYAEMNRFYWTDLPDFTGEDAHVASMKFKSGAIGHVVGTCGAVPDRWWLNWSITCRNIYLELPDFNTVDVYYTRLRPLKITSLHEDRDPYLLAERDLIEAVLHDRTTRIPISEGAKTLELTLAVRRSMETGKVTPLPL